jgi:hypothetical protein
LTPDLTAERVVRLSSARNSKVPYGDVGASENALIIANFGVFELWFPLAGYRDRPDDGDKYQQSTRSTPC